MSENTTRQTSVQVRQNLVEALRLDLVGPDNDHMFANELLPESPIKWYLTGFLVPTDAPIEQRFDETSTEEIDSPAEPDGLDDAQPPDRTTARRSLLPSSIGLSFLVPEGTTALRGAVMWGDYVFESPDGKTDAEAQESEADPEPDTVDLKQDADSAQANSPRNLRGFRRIPRTEPVVFDLPETGETPRQIPVPNSDGLFLVVTARQTGMESLPDGSKAVSVFLVNSRRPDEDSPVHTFAFQACIEVTCPDGFVARPDPRGWDLEDDWDQRVSDLQYIDVFEYAVGHGASAEADIAEDGLCKLIRTTWVPTAEVERVAPAAISDIELGMEALGGLIDGRDAHAKLNALVVHYRNWIEAQARLGAQFTGTRAQTADEMVIDARTAANRIEAGIRLLENPDVLEAFKIANRAVASSARQRFARIQEVAPEEVVAPAWRPFQLAFMLMTIRGIVEPQHADREQVDLLFFPTGGGKTEAYLGLAAFTLVLRRSRNPGIRSAGMAVLMRYTLRLLTLDQLGRAAGLICALELEREQNPALGMWPFEIGLWVGQAATPNRMGRRGDQSSSRIYTAYTKTTQFQKDPRKPSPIPIEECPWCGTKFTRHSFRLIPNIEQPTDLRVHCTNHNCSFHGDRHLPIVAVDEPIYRRLPCFLIATVDKFAALPWTGETGTLFGKVDRYDQDGFYGPCTPRQGTPIPDGQLPPPELIIQDELHLISGPLGTIAGLYETVIDSLSTQDVNGAGIRPKIIASTATVRRAESQIRALFERTRVSVFPPQGPNRRDSFFAETLFSSQSPARNYVGIAAQGRSFKVILLRAALALLSAGQTAWEENGGNAAENNSADPYMTLLGYFNSLRELGGSRRIIEDEVRTRLMEYRRRRRRDPEDRLFRNRSIAYEVLELTSRVATNNVAIAKRRLSLPFSNEERVDVALATNMISVGLDITRLGLMMVLGQPKTSSEYIQATSRVGRNSEKPGLILTIFNIHRPRDRSHYERFRAYHSSFYRNVEATSVTPFSPRALDRALPATLVALCRQQRNDMTPYAGANQILQVRAELEHMAQRIAERARNYKQDMSEADRQALYANVLHRCNRLLDYWFQIAERAMQQGSSLQYQREAPTPPRRLLYEFLHPELVNLHPIHMNFRANRSMRDVEAAVEINVQNLHDWGEDE